MNEINPNGNYSGYYAPNPSASKKKRLGATVAGALIGMNAYYLPIKKDTFVQRAFDITKEEANQKIRALTQAAKEVENKKVNTISKMILQEMGVPEDLQAITNKCIEIDKEVSDPTKVINLKTQFANNFANYKKTQNLMDNNCASAYKAIKRSKFWWGTGIGATIGLALGLLSSKD